MMYFCYIDGEFRYLDPEEEPDVEDRINPNVDAGICEICGGPAGTDDIDILVESLPLYTPIPINVCARCGLEYYNSCPW